MDNEGEHFKIALAVILVSIAASLYAFRSEDSLNQATGFAVSDYETDAVQEQSLLEFRAVSSLGSLAAGTYYVNEDGIVYWMDDSSLPPIGKVTHLKESQKNRQIFIDKDGNVGYLIR